MECPECSEVIRHGLPALVKYENEVPEVSWNIAAQKKWHCENCDKSYYTGDFEVLNEDEI